MKVLDLGLSVRSGGWLLFTIAISLGVVDGIYRVVSSATVWTETFQCLYERKTSIFSREACFEARSS